MTKEKLEELGALARDLKDRNANLYAATEMEAFAPKGPQPADLLLRIMEERERLLQALAHAVETLDDGRDKWPYTKAPDLWREAIAFAEAPADQVAERPQAH